MRKLLCVALWGILAAGCRSDLDSRPGLVSDVAMPAQEAFDPGDPVTVRARGFDFGDEVVFDIRWPLQGELFDEGVARGVRAVVTDRSAESVTFLAPGGYPASTVGVLLRRGGYFQTLGTISVSDGLPPAEFGLYGLTDGASGERSLCRIDRETGETTPLLRFAAGEEPRCVVNAPGSNAIDGILVFGGRMHSFRYDLTMRYRSVNEPEGFLAAGRLGSSVRFIACRDGWLYPHAAATRDPGSVCWRLPEGVSAERLACVPFAYGSNGYLLWSLDHGQGRFSAFVLSPPSTSGRCWVGEPVRADALLPFLLIRPAAQGSSQSMEQVGGYVVSGADGGVSELRLYDWSETALGAPFATLPEPVRSVAFEHTALGTLLYLLTDDGIRIYDSATGSWRRLPLGTACTEIVLAR